MQLPLEVLLHIIDQFLPDGRQTLLPPSHSSTKALLVFTQVCRGTYPLASAYLVRYCLFIDSSTRLHSLLSMLATRHQANLPDIDRLRNLTSLYLAPFGESLYDRQISTEIRDLFLEVSGTLKRLVIDIPLRSLWPANDRLGVRKALREGFTMLTRLEEFVSIRDELFLRTFEGDEGIDEVDVWTLWPELRRMALYNRDADADFWHRVGEMPKLDSLVLTRADGLQESCMKTAYLSRTDRPLKVVLANVSSDHPAIPRWRWNTVDPSMKMRVLVYDVPTSFYGDEDPIDLCQSWVRKAALAGNLWDWDGLVLKGAPSSAGLTDPAEPVQLVG